MYQTQLQSLLLLFYDLLGHLENFDWRVVWGQENQTVGFNGSSVRIEDV